MAEMTTETANALFTKAAELARKEKNLWEGLDRVVTSGTGKKVRFGDITDAKGDKTAHKLITEVIDPYFADGLDKVKKGPDGLPLILKDARAQAFFKANPDAEKVVTRYAREYTDILEQTKAFNEQMVEAGVPAADAEKVSAAIIKNIDDRYADGGTRDKGLDTSAIAAEEIGKVAPKVMDAASPDITGRLWPEGFDVNNADHLLTLAKEAEAFKGKDIFDPKSVKDGDAMTPEQERLKELSDAYIEAKKAYYTDATVGPNYIKDLLGKDFKGAIVKDQAQYEADFKTAMAAKKTNPDTELPKVPENIVRAMQEKLGVENINGKMDAATQQAIIDNKNGPWIKSIVTDATQASIEKNIDAKEKVKGLPLVPMKGVDTGQPGGPGASGQGPGKPQQR